jgi:hypothetical protein
MLKTFKGYLHEQCFSCRSVSRDTKNIVHVKKTLMQELVRFRDQTSTVKNGNKFF